MRIILSHILLRDLEQPTLGVLHQFGYIGSLVKSLTLDLAGKRNELTSQEFLRQDIGVILDMGRRSHARTQLDNTCTSPDIFQRSFAFQFLRNRENIHWALIHIEMANCSENFLIPRLIESFGTNDFTDNRESIFVDHQRTQHYVFDFQGLRLQMPVLRIDRSR